MRPSSFEALYEIADELRAVANLGLRFAENAYDRERYEKVLSASARMVSTIEERPAEEVLLQFKDNLAHVSPNAGADCAVFRDGEILLIRREDNGLWAMPGGFVDVGETLAGAAERELREEANIRGRAVKLVGIFDSRILRSQTKAHLYHAVFLVEAEPGTPEAGPETTDVGYFPEDRLPDLSPGHETKVRLAFQFHRGQASEAYFDQASPDSR
jgi:ADP-ribose pyrophosphatase YjhB (NUDIX family)